MNELFKEGYNKRQEEVAKTIKMHVDSLKEDSDRTNPYYVIGICEAILSILSNERIRFNDVL